MIISGKQVQNIAKIYGEQNKITKDTKKEVTASTGKKDEVILSTNAQEFGQLMQAAKGMSEVREDKVKEFSERIASGNYHVDAKDIAEKMI